MVVFVGDKPMRGLTYVLQRTFYPFSSHKMRCLGKERGRVTGNKRKRRALADGKKTDRSLTNLVNGTGGQITAHAKMIRDYVTAKGMKMVATQVPVYCEEANVGTDIDLVCEFEGKHVIFEIKTGFRGYYHAHSGSKMTSPFQAMNDSVCHQHMLQVMFSMDMYRKVHPTQEVDVARTAVLVVNEDVTEYNVMDFLHLDWEKKLSESYFLFKLTKSETVAQRTRAIKREQRLAKKQKKSNR